MSDHRRSLVAGAVALAVALAAQPDVADAQLSLEGRIGSGIPTGEVTDAPFRQTGGLAFAAEAMWNLSPRMTFYGGVSRQSFNCDGCFSDLSSTGFQSGLKFLLSRDGQALPWVRGGLLLHDAEMAGDDSGWGLGFDSGVGVDWRVSPRFDVVPALRYAQYTTDDLTLGFLTIDLGLHVHVH